MRSRLASADLASALSEESSGDKRSSAGVIQRADGVDQHMPTMQRVCYLSALAAVQWATGVFACTPNNDLNAVRHTFSSDSASTTVSP